MPTLFDPVIRPLHPDEQNVLFGMDATKWLHRLGASSIDSVVSISSEPTGLTFGTPAVNASTFINSHDGTVAIGKGVQVAVTPSGSDAGTTYRVECKIAVGTQRIVIGGWIKCQERP